MGKIIRKKQIKNAHILMSRQRDGAGGWEYPVWVFVEDKKEKGFGVEQDPTIFNSKGEAGKRFDEIVSALNKDFKFGIQVYAPQGRDLV